MEEVRDPVHATNAFYDALAKVEGYEQLEITVAAQEVQRSGFPDAYADHEPDARALASALTGNSPEAFSCRLGDSDDGSDRPRGLRADRPRGRRTPRPGRDVPGPAARRLRARRGLHRPHGGLGALRRPRDRRLRPPGLDGEQDPRLGDRAVPRQPGRPARDQDRDLRRPDLDLRPPLGRRLARLRPARSARATRRSSSTATTCTWTSTERLATRSSALAIGPGQPGRVSPFGGFSTPFRSQACVGGNGESNG